MSSIYDIGADKAYPGPIPVTFTVVTHAEDRELRLIEAMLGVLRTAENDDQRDRVLQYVSDRTKRVQG